MNNYMTREEVKQLIMETTLDCLWSISPLMVDDGAKTAVVIYSTYANDGIRQLCKDLIERLEEDDDHDDH